jgi:hypothetical protein
MDPLPAAGLAIGRSIACLHELRNLTHRFTSVVPEQECAL